MAREVRVAILGDSRDFSRAVRDAQQDAGRLDGAFGRIAGGAGRMASAVALGAGALAVGAGAAAVSFVRAAEESQQVSRQTEAVLASMGATSWATAEGVAALSEQLSLKTGIDDELIQSGQNVLLTFAAVQNRVGEGNDIFDRATTAALDMSVALGTDMAGASMSVGRALNDPIRGLTALRRSGIQFTEQQEEQIRTMVEAGDVAGAQRVMLEELERQFGGSAEAQATASGKLATAWGNIQEQLGEVLLPIFESVAQWLAKMLPGAVDAASRVLREIVGGVRAFAAAFTAADGDITSSGFPGFMERVGFIASQVLPVVRDGLVTAFNVLREAVMRFIDIARGLGDWLIDHKPILIGITAAIGVGLVAAFVSWAVAAASAAAATIAAAAPIIAIGVAIAALVAGIIWAYQNWGWFRDAVDAVARFMTDTLWPALKQVADFIMNNVVPVVVRLIGWWVELQMKVAEVAIWIVRHFDDLVRFITGLPGRIASVASGMFDGIKNAFRSAINWIINAWNGLSFSVPGFDPPGPGSFGGFTFRVPQIPTLHSGGIFQAPGGAREGLALLESGEGVTSRADMARGGGGSTTLVLQVGTLEFGRVTLDGLVAVNRVDGPLQISVA